MQKNRLKVSDWNCLLFQPKNDPKHAANALNKHLDRKTHNRVLSVMDCLPQSPDLNVIEAMWDHPDKEHDTRQSTSNEEL